ncbi:MAG: phosphoadenylyl-sulfate reductase [Candidatus Accumulibacter sp.]|nr:phosphoadenylyl-sulfate reductase [Accumulibacter sp.]
MPAIPSIDLDDAALRASLARKIEDATALLRRVAAEYRPAALANSLGAEDMVLTDLIHRERLDIDNFSLDTGRLPAETYELIAVAERRYGRKPSLYYPRHELLEAYVRAHGINAFYQSVELRKGCCHARKVEPLRRALAGKKAWITGLRARQSATRAGLPRQVFDEVHGLEKFNPLADWTEREIWAYIRLNDVPYNALHDRFYPSIGCAPCTRAVTVGEDIRAGRWWWELPETKECGLHFRGQKTDDRGQ